MQKAVFVTGAASGTGNTIARRFAREGYAVCISSRDTASAQRAAAEIARDFNVPVLGFGLVPGNGESEIAQAFAAIREKGLCVEALVLNAANLGMNQPALSVPIEEFRDVIDTNLVWNFAVMRQAALQMKEMGGGAICVIGSNTAHRAIPDRGAYIASKGGLIALVKAMAIEWGIYGIRVNALVSGSIKTARWDAATEEWREERRKRAPIGDIADFEDIANTAFFLCSEQSRVTTGTEIYVDGGVDAQYLPRK